MARTETEQLVFSVEARIAAMEKQMARAGRVTDKTFTGMENRSKRAARTMEKEMAGAASRVGALMKNFGRGLFAGIAAGGVVGVVSQIGQVAASIADIRVEAARAGVSTRVFQEWRVLAEQARIPIDNLTDGFKELAIRADEFASTGKGSAAEAFQRLGLTPAEVKEKLKDPAELLLLLIERTRKLGDTAAGIRVFDELFGGGGERMVSLLQMSDKEVRNIIQSAHDGGRVMDEKLIAKAEELDKIFSSVATTVSTQLQTAILRAYSQLWSFIEMFQKWENVRRSTVDERLAAIGKERLDLENKILAIRHEQSEISDTAKDLGFGSSSSGVYSDQADRISELRKQMAALADEEERIYAARKGIDDLPAKPEASTITTPSLPPGGGGTGSRNNSAAATEREAEAVRRLIGELQEELRLVGATSVEKEISATLRRANVDAASAEGQQIISLVMQIDRETEALEKNRQAQEARTQAVENMFNMGADALTSMVDGSMKAEEAIKRLAMQLALAAAQAAFLGSGPLAGLFGGGLFNLPPTHRLPGLADGGPTGAASFTSQPEIIL